jgi:hypothetical protein
MAKEDEENTIFITPFRSFLFRADAGGLEKRRPNFHQNDSGGIQAADW